MKFTIIGTFQYLSAVRYVHEGDTHGCCVNDGMFHERCHCSAPLQTCKTYCDQDPSCKGYVQSWNYEKCDYATTSHCQQSCSKFDRGKVGSLGGDCGSDYGKCYVKQTGMNYNLVMISF